MCLVTTVAATLSQVEGEAEVCPVILDGGEHTVSPIPPGDKWTTILGGACDAVMHGVTRVGTDKADTGDGLTRSAS